jgi:hypothetical protein
VFADNEVPPRFGELTIRALHPRGEVDEALPFVITHGWSSTVLEVLPLAQRLAWPSQHGGAAADAFHVVVAAVSVSSGRSHGRVGSGQAPPSAWQLAAP